MSDFKFILGASLFCAALLGGVTVLLVWADWICDSGLVACASTR